MSTACSIAREPGVYKTSQHNKINRIKVKLIGRLFLCAVIFSFSFVMSHSQIFVERARIEHFISDFFFSLCMFCIVPSLSIAALLIRTRFPILNGGFLVNMRCVYIRQSMAITHTHTHTRACTNTYENHVCASKTWHFMQ